jgi:hypothetical protein
VTARVAIIGAASAGMGASVERDAAVRRRYIDPRFGFIWDRLPYGRRLESESAAA